QKRSLKMATKVSAISSKRRRSKKPVVAVSRTRQISLSPVRAIALPLASAAIVAAATFLPGFAEAPAARWSCWASAGFLGLWAVALLVDAERCHRSLSVEISLRKQHY